MTIRRWLTGGLAVCALTASLWARPGTVKTREGASYTGDVSEDEDGKVVVKVHGIDMRVDRRDVASVVYTDDAQAEFKKRLAALGPKDVAGRLALATWAMEQQQYDLARQAAQSALDADPNSKEATDMLTMIRRQQEIERAGKTPAAQPPKAPGTNDPLLPDEPNGKTPGAAVERKTLSVDDINIIKQFELRSDETTVRATFTNDVRKRFVETHPTPGGSLAQFSSLPMDRQVRNIIENAPELRKDVRITSDPAAIVMYRQRVQPAILAGCATTSCHGGSQSGDFVLVVPADTDAATYTNFYILTQYARKIDKNAVVPMIDRTTPAKSLLLQYALPNDAGTEFHHPDVPGYRPLFRTAGDVRYKAITDWLNGALNPTAPDYGIKFTPPTGTSPDSTTKPAAK